MDVARIREDVKGFIRNSFMLGRPEGYLQDGDSLIDKGVIDSTGVLELMGHLEETYGFAVEDREVTPENLGSVDGIVAFVAAKTGIQGTP